MLIVQAHAFFQCIKPFLAVWISFAIEFRTYLEIESKCCNINERKINAIRRIIYLFACDIFQEFNFVWTGPDPFTEHHLTQIFDGRIVFIDLTKIKMMIFVRYDRLLRIQAIHKKGYCWLLKETNGADET